MILDAKMPLRSSRDDTFSESICEKKKSNSLSLANASAFPVSKDGVAAERRRFTLPLNGSAEVPTNESSGVTERFDSEDKYFTPQEDLTGASKTPNDLTMLPANVFGSSVGMDDREENSIGGPSASDDEALIEAGDFCVLTQDVDPHDKSKSSQTSETTKHFDTFEGDLTVHHDDAASGGWVDDARCSDALECSSTNAQTTERNTSWKDPEMVYENCIAYVPPAENTDVCAEPRLPKINCSDPNVDSPHEVLAKEKSSSGKLHPSVACASMVSDEAPHTSGGLDHSASVDEEIERNRAMFPYPMLLELMHQSKGLDRRIQMSTIAKFLHLCNNRGQRLFTAIESNPSTHAFFKALRAADKLHNNRSGLALCAASADDGNCDDADEWEEEEQDEGLFYSAKVLWDQLPYAKRKLVLSTLSSASTIVCHYLYPELEAKQRDVTGVSCDNLSGYGNEGHCQPNGRPSPCGGLESESSGVVSPGVPHREGAVQQFRWEALPPALKVIYDQQGYRDEMIDGPTFWRFITRCTLAVPGQAIRNSRRRVVSGTSNVEAPLPPLTQLPHTSHPTCRQTASLTPVVASGFEHSPPEDVLLKSSVAAHNNDAPPVHQDNRRISLVPTDNTELIDCETSVGKDYAISVGKRESLQCDETVDEQVSTEMVDMLIAMLQQAGIEVQGVDSNETEIEDKIVHLRDALAAQFGPECTPQALIQSLMEEQAQHHNSEEAEREQFLRSIVAERRRDPAKRHLAEIWEELLNDAVKETKTPYQEAGETRSHRNFFRSISHIRTPFGIRDKLRSWKHNRRATPQTA